MESSAWIDELDRPDAADAVVDVRARLVRAEADRLVLAAHWAGLHGEDDPNGAGPGGVLPGAERFVFVGGDGTPSVGEFAAAELAALLQVSIAAASNLVADSLDLRHRHPMLWHAVDEGSVEAWKACKVARRTRAVGLSHAQSLWVDMVTSPLVGSLSWAAFWDRLEAAIVEVDPAAAEERRHVAAMERFVTTGQSNEYGLKTIVAKAAAGDAIFFVAMCDRLAQILLLDGDTDPVQVRRSKAIGILADPARALAMLQRYAEVAADEVAPLDEPADDWGDDLAQGDGDAAADREGGDDLSPELAPGPDTDVAAGSSCGVVAGSPVPFVRPMHVDPAKLRPSAVLHLHMSRESWEAARNGRNTGVVRFEGVGPITVPQAVEVLSHCNVRVSPVVDLAEDRPVDGYEVPERMREILFQHSPTCVFPWSPNRSRRADVDHTTPYLARDKAGPPGQTRVANLGRLSRKEHRVKTHAPGWRHHQPEPGMHLWRTPAGYWFQVDHRGTHPLGRHARMPWPTTTPEPADARTKAVTDVDTCWPLRERSVLERQLVDMLSRS